MKTMKKWKLIARGKNLDKEEIQRAIFQEDVISALQFVIAMM